MKMVQIKQGSLEWLAWRKSGLGGSDAPVVEGSSPYRTRLQLFREKRGLAVQPDGNEYIFRRGHESEAQSRALFTEHTGVDMVPVCIEHPKYPFMLASLDGFDPKLGILENKLVGKDVLTRARMDGEIPRDHFIQIQHQMEVADVDQASWFGHDGKKTGIVIPIKRDPALMRKLIEQEHEFWELVKSGKEPPLSSQDYLIPEDQSLLIELREAKEHAENTTAHYEAIRKKVIETYRHDRIAGGGVKVIKVVRQGSINYKSVPELKNLTPEYLDQFRGKGSESWMVRMDNEKEEASA